VLETKASQPVITVTLTPAVDVAISVHELVPGKLHRLPAVRQDPGGKGINVSKALRAFGIPTLATGFLGGDRGQWIRTKLDELSIPHDFVDISEETRMNVKVSEGNGRLTEFNSVSPAGAAANWQELEAKISNVQPGQWIAFCGRLPDEMNAWWYRDAIELAKERGAFTLLDSSGDGLRFGCQAKPDIVKPNRTELTALIGRRLNTTAEVVAAATDLVKEGIGTVVVSLGGDGVVAVTEAGVFQTLVPEVVTESSVGAGDTLVAGLLYGLHRGLSFADCLQLAAAAGTCATRTPGTESPTLASVEALVPQTRVIVL